VVIEPGEEMAAAIDIPDSLARYLAGRQFCPDLRRVEAVVQALEDLGIFHLDVSTGNFSIHQGSW